MLDYKTYLNDDELETIDAALRQAINEVRHDINTDADAQWLKDLDKALFKINCMQIE